MKLHFCILASVLLLSACVKISDIDGGDPASNPEIPSLAENQNPDESVNSAEQTPDFQLVTFPESNRYHVLLRLPPETQVVQRFEQGSESKREVMPMKVQGSVFRDDNPQAGRSYVYEFGAMLNGTYQVLGLREVKVPRDLVIEGNMTLQQNTNWNIYHRVYFPKNTTLTTMGYQLIIQTDEIIAQGGKLQTFPPGSTSGTNGRSGGSITLLAATASGELQVELRGQKGGEGPTAPCIINIDPNFGRHGPPPFRTVQTVRTNMTLNQVPQVGFDGGDTGQLSVELRQEHSLKIKTAFEPGTGGIGGLLAEACKIPRSARGPVGSPGEKQTSCLRDIHGVTCE